MAHANLGTVYEDSDNFEQTSEEKLALVLIDFETFLDRGLYHDEGEAGDERSVTPRHRSSDSSYVRDFSLVAQLSGSHGEWTMGDDLADGNFPAIRRNREARNHRFQRAVNQPREREPDPWMDRIDAFGDGIRGRFLERFQERDLARLQADLARLGNQNRRGYTAAEGRRAQLYRIYLQALRQGLQGPALYEAPPFLDAPMFTQADRAYLLHRWAEAGALVPNAGIEQRRVALLYWARFVREQAMGGPGNGVVEDSSSDESDSDVGSVDTVVVAGPPLRGARPRAHMDNHVVPHPPPPVQPLAEHPALVHGDEVVAQIPVVVEEAPAPARLRFLRNFARAGFVGAFIKRRMMRYVRGRLRANIYVKQELPYAERIFLEYQFHIGGGVSILSGSYGLWLVTSAGHGHQSVVAHAIHSALGVAGTVTAHALGMAAATIACAAAPVALFMVPHYLYGRWAHLREGHHVLYGRPTVWARYEDVRLFQYCWSVDHRSYMQGYGYNGTRAVVIHKATLDYLLHRRSGNQGSLETSHSLVNEVRLVFPPVTAVQAVVQLDTIIFFSQMSFLERRFTARHLNEQSTLPRRPY